MKHSLCIVTAVACLLFAGCTNPYGRTIASTSTLGTGALQGWNIYSQNRLDIGKPVPISQDEAVLDASLQFDLAENIAEAAYHAWEDNKANTNIEQTLQLSIDTFVAQGSNIVELIRTFQKGSTP